MRLQSAMFCDEVTEEADGSATLRGATAWMGFQAVWEGDPADRPPLLPMQKKLVLYFVEGDPGGHDVWLVISNLELPNPLTTSRQTFAWPHARLTCRFAYDIELGLPIGGLYDFQIFIDGDPVGTVPLLITADFKREDPRTQSPL